MPLPAEEAFAPIQRIGGREGWYYGDLRRLRGLLDLPFGGAGTRRGRRDPVHLLPGDTVDFWRVEAIEPDHLLRLTAEMSLPGRAWLQWEVEPSAGDSVRPRSSIPSASSGACTGTPIWPVHGFVFNGLIRGIARAAADRRTL